MKQLLILLNMSLVSFALVGCGGEGEPSTPEENEENQTIDDSKQQTEESGDNTIDSINQEQMLDESGYMAFELEVDYGKDQEYEAEIEQKNDALTAELEDELNDEELVGEAAFDRIYPLVKQLTLKQDTPQDEAIVEILDVFNLDDDYIEFEAELTFSDGVKIEFEDKK